MQYIVMIIIILLSAESIVAQDNTGVQTTEALSSIKIQDEEGILRYQSAIKEYRSGNWILSKKLFLEFVALLPRSPQAVDAQVHAALAAFSSGSMDDFEQMAPKAIATLDAISSQTATTRIQKLDLQYRLGQCEFQKSNWPGAKRIFLEVASTHDPLAADIVYGARYNAAMTAFHAEEYEKFSQLASQFLDAATSESQEVREIRFQKGVAPFRQRKWDDAVASFDDFVSKYPASANAELAAYNAAIALHEKGDLKGFDERASNYLQSYASAPHERRDKMLSYQARSDYNSCKWDEFREKRASLIASNASADFLPSLEYMDVFISYWQDKYDEFLSKAAELLDKQPNLHQDEKENLRAHMALSLALKGNPSAACDDLQRMAEEAKSTASLRVTKLLLGRALMIKSDSQKVHGDPAAVKATSQLAAKTLGEMRAEASKSLAKEKYEDTIGGIENMIMESLFYERNFEGLANTASYFCAKHQPPTKAWANAGVWMAMGKASLAQPDYDGAAKILDEVLGANIEDTNLLDHIPTSAAIWRIAVAKAQGDELTAKTVMEKLKIEMPAGPTKDRAMTKMAAFNKR